MKRILSLFALLTFLLLAGCADFRNGIQKNLVDNTAGNYHILKYSGGKLVEEFWLHNVKVTQNTNTDGLYFIKDGHIFEVQGDVTIVRFDGDFQGPDVIPQHLLQY